jgi:hypothetical protein
VRLPYRRQKGRLPASQVAGYDGRKSIDGRTAQTEMPQTAFTFGYT